MQLNYPIKGHKLQQIFMDIKKQKQILNFTNKLQQITTNLLKNDNVRKKIHEYSIDTDQVIQKFLLWSKKINFLSKQLSKCDSAQFVIKLFYILNLQRIYYEDQSQTKIAAIYLQIYSKLSYFFEVLRSILEYKGDITSDTSFTNDKYMKIYKRIIIKEHKDIAKRQQQTQKLKKLMVINNSAVITELYHQNMLLRVINFGISYPRFLIDYDEAQLRNNAFLCNPKIEILQQIWNLIEKGAIGKLKYIQFQYILTNQMIYIPSSPELFHLNILKQEPNKIPVRILYNYQTYFEQDSQNCCIICNDRPFQTMQKIILHLHGGGFISLSSDVTQDYTRKWAKSLRIPVFSVDYSLAPQQRFPTAVNQVFTVYKYLISQLHKCSNINPKKIILAGDSAGGNLVCSLMALILKEGLTPPHAIFLAYPAVDLRKHFTPSKINSFNHPILQPSLLNLCLSSYIGQSNMQNTTNPLISPLLLTESFVNSNSKSTLFPHKWPKTRIMIGNQDPLYDDSLRLLQRMVEANIDVECIMYKSLSHAFLSFTQFYSDSEATIDDSIKLLQQLLL